MAISQLHRPCKKMIDPSSQRSAEFDQFLLAVEELFRQRLPERAVEELERLDLSQYTAPGLARGLYLALRAEGALFVGRYTEAIELGAEALSLLAPSSQHRRVGRTLWNLSKSYSMLGELPEAELRARDAIAAYRRAERREGVVDGLNELAKIAFIRSQYPRAAEFLQDALVLIERDPAKEQQIRSNLGRVKTLAGQLDEAEKLLKTALDYDLANDLEMSAARNYMSLGYLRFRQRRFSEASEAYDRAEKLIRKRSMLRERLNLAEYRGELAFEKGDYSQARETLNAALKESEELAPDS
ncbi:MAG TPA: tetratricopeptide repeat protein, partial [candidate division Zixibacteria bacterium]|nr:tetratricopeptide repeat protein [candidate division Zixibacteria bacterium]